MFDIKKIKLESDYCLKVEFEQTTTHQEGESQIKTTTEFAVTYRHRVHPDLIESLDRVKPHLACLCELTDNPDAAAPELLSKLKVTGLGFGGHDEHYGVTVIGRKDLKTKKVLNLIAPFTKFEGGEHEPGYDWSHELGFLCEGVKSEVIQYMEGKYAPNKQLEMELV